jgi:putative intracellular protease/amidase
MSGPDDQNDPQIQTHHERQESMDIAILIYPRFTALDAIGPYEVLSRLPDAKVTFVAEHASPQRTDTGQLAVVADAIEELRALGADATPERVVFDGKLATAAGVTAGIDMALELAAKISSVQVAQAIQLGLEYDPQPPFDAGSPEKAPAEIVEAVRAYSRFEQVA